MELHPVKFMRNEVNTIKSINITDGDLFVNSKRLQTVMDIDQKKQKTRQLLLTAKGELFYNANIGLDLTEILDVKEKNISVERKKVAIMECLSYDENIEKVLSIDIIKNQDRSQTINLQIKYKDEIENVTIGGITVG